MIKKVKWVEEIIELHISIRRTDEALKMDIHII